MIYFLGILFSIGSILIYYGYNHILNLPFEKEVDPIRLNKKISVNELGFMEGRVIGLNEIIIIADRVEEPTNELLQSVKENIKRGVKYIFLISNNSFETEKQSYWRIFQAIGETVKNSYNVKNQVEIYPLNFSWNDYPFIFYRYFEGSKQKAFAYMGTELREGIADSYEAINPTIAIKMLNLAFQGVKIPKYEKITIEELYDSEPKIIPITKII